MNPHHYMANKTPEERRAIAKKAHETRRKNKEAAETWEREVREQAILRAEGLQQRIDKLKTELEGLEKYKEFNTIVMPHLASRTLFREAEIVAAAKPWNDDFTGVYFLVCSGTVVYVGQAVNVYARIAQHRNSKIFDGYAYIPCEKEMLDRLESLYIHYLRPELNGDTPSGHKHAPLSLDWLLIDGNN